MSPQMWKVFCCWGPGKSPELGVRSLVSSCGCQIDSLPLHLSVPIYKWGPTTGWPGPSHSVVVGIHKRNWLWMCLGKAQHIFTLGRHDRALREPVASTEGPGHGMTYRQKANNGHFTVELSLHLLPPLRA